MHDKHHLKCICLAYKIIFVCSEYSFRCTTHMLTFCYWWYPQEMIMNCSWIVPDQYMIISSGYRYVVSTCSDSYIFILIGNNKILLLHVFLVCITWIPKTHISVMYYLNHKKLQNFTSWISLLVIQSISNVAPRLKFSLDSPSAWFKFHNWCFFLPYYYIKPIRFVYS